TWRDSTLDQGCAQLGSLLRQGSRAQPQVGRRRPFWLVCIQCDSARTPRRFLAASTTDANSRPRLTISCGYLPTTTPRSLNVEGTPPWWVAPCSMMIHACAKPV